MTRSFGFEQKKEHGDYVGNRVYITSTKFTSLHDSSESWGVRVYDSEESDYIDHWKDQPIPVESGESLQQAIFRKVAGCDCTPIITSILENALDNGSLIYMDHVELDHAWVREVLYGEEDCEYDEG